tara:strand:+ start:30 stop:647 length:618 start_codon:yes stop_codon:yes gene_type:complete
MVATIFLIRHCETDANISQIPQGVRDVPLNKKGIQQSEQIALWACEQNFDQILSSTSSRAQDVARMISTKIGIEVKSDVRLCEFDQGIFDGMPLEQIRKDHPEFIQSWRNDDPTNLRMPQGETFGEVQKRMVQVCEEIAFQNDNANIAVISHNLSIKSALCFGLNIPLIQFRNIEVNLASFSVISIEHNQWWRVEKMNDLCHINQ